MSWNVAAVYAGYLARAPRQPDRTQRFAAIFARSGLGLHMADTLYLTLEGQTRPMHGDSVILFRRVSACHHTTFGPASRSAIARSPRPHPPPAGSSMASLRETWGPESLRRCLASGNVVVARAVVGVMVDGTFRVEMRCSDGRCWLTRGAYREVVPQRRLMSAWRWEGSDSYSHWSARRFSIAVPRPADHGETELIRQTKPANDQALNKSAFGMIADLVRLRGTHACP